MTEKQEQERAAEMDQMLAQLRTLWELLPEMRMAQIFANLVNDGGQQVGLCQCGFYMQDEALRKAMRSWQTELS